MSNKKTFIGFITIILFLFAFSAYAKTDKSERWYGVFYKGKKIGRSHTVLNDYTEDGANYRKVHRKTFARIKLTASYSGSGINASRDFTFELNSKVDALLRDGKLVYLKVKTTGTRGPATIAKTTLEGDTLIMDRREGVVIEKLKIKPDDYQMTTEPSDMEPFLETITDAPISRKVFNLQSAEIKDVLFIRLKDSKAKDVDGKEKPCKVFKSTDDETETIMKTVNGKIVYIRSKDIKDDRSIIFYWTSKQKATSDTGY